VSGGVRQVLQVDHDARLELIRHAAHAHQGGIAHARERLRREIQSDAGIVAVLIPQRLGPRQVRSRVLGPGTRCIAYRQADERAHLRGGGDPRGFLGQGAVIGVTGDPGPQHLGDREPRAIAHEVRAQSAPLEG